MATNPADGVDYSPQLQSLMRRVGFDSYRALRARAGVSRWAINLLRQGQVERLRVETLLLLSQALETSVTELIGMFRGADPGAGTEAPSPNIETTPETWQREYERLQQQLVKQEDEIRQRLQQDAIAILESWLLQWPTAAYAVQQNASLPASRLLPLTKPLDMLLQSWHLAPIGTVGEDVPFDPQIHQPMGGTPEAGQLVRVRYVGYRHGDRLLYRAKVSPLG